MDVCCFVVDFNTAKRVMAGRGADKYVIISQYTLVDAL
jgi:hypothetical protein